MKTRLTVVLVLVFGAARARAQEPTIRINPSGAELYRIGIPGADPAARVVANDLDLTGFFKILDPRAFPAALSNEPTDTINATNWMQVGGQSVAKVRTGSSDTECRLFEIAKGERPVLSKRYSGLEMRVAAHECANDLIKYFTGEDGFFGTQITFAQGGRGRVREIMAMDFDGANVHQVTRMNAVSLLPSWSPSAREIAFLSFVFGGADLWIAPAGGGRARRVTRSQDAISGAAWSPDGSRLAVTLSRGGNADIYLVNREGGLLRRLTDNGAIDTSPAWSPDGSQIAFVSNRLGNPQIYLMGADGSGARRLTYQGTYNQTPRWCPRRDTPLIAFTARDEKLHFDLFTVDARSGQIVRLTQNQGDNEDPTFSPNCRVVAFKSSRGGIWILNPNTRVEHQVYKGAVEAPRWGPAVRR
ncbi:MAG TPA: protein TolB [Polyangia bacterium]|nr:protein TolB [Polyangia bacterium]